MKRSSFLSALVLCLEKLGEIDAYFKNPRRVAHDYWPDSKKRSAGLWLLKRKGIIPQGSALEKIDKDLVFSNLDPQLKSKAKLWRLSSKPWDGYWRIVIFDIPEEKRKTRDAVRKYLKLLGFRQFQRSVWVSLLPLKKEVMEFLTNMGVAGRAIIFETKEFWIGDLDRFIDRVWQVGQARNRWKAWIKKASSSKEDKEGLIAEFFGILERDPLLPQDFLGKDWPLFKAIKLYKKLRDI